MTVDPQLVGLVQAVAGVASLGFLKPALDNRDTTGSRSYGLFMLGIALWSFALSVGNFTGDYRLSMLAYNLVVLGAAITAVAWLLLALEVTDRTALARRVFGVLAASVLAIQLLIWTNPFHHLAFGTGTHLDGVVLVPEYAAGFWLHTGFAYGCALLAEAILIGEAIRSTGIRRRQAIMLSVAAVPIIISNLLYLFTDLFVPYDISPFGYLLATVIFGLVLFRDRFLDITTVARRTAMAEMNDAMVTLDKDNRVIDANSRARELFDVGDDYVGIPAADFFVSVPQDVLAEFATGTVTDTEISVELDGQQRHFLLSISQVGDRTSQGRVVLFHDITAQKRHEQELQRQNERLDQFATMASHDLRNPLNVAGMRLDLARQEFESDHLDTSLTALERMETIIDDLLTLARQGEPIDDLDVVSLEELANQSWDVVETTQAALSVERDGRFLADGERLQQLFENLYRNAIEHGAEDVTITVGVIADEDGFYVADDGPGIPEADRKDAFEFGFTTNEDGTGYGLGIVKEIVDAHKWSIAITDASDGGARFEITGVDFELTP
jgi:signal transduction histidine kinase